MLCQSVVGWLDDLLSYAKTLSDLFVVLCEVLARCASLGSASTRRSACSSLDNLYIIVSGEEKLRDGMSANLRVRFL